MYGHVEQVGDRRGSPARAPSLRCSCAAPQQRDHRRVPGGRPDTWRSRAFAQRGSPRVKAKLPGWSSARRRTVMQARRSRSRTRHVPNVSSAGAAASAAERPRRRRRQIRRSMLAMTGSIASPLPRSNASHDARTRARASGPRSVVDDHDHRRVDAGAEALDLFPAQRAVGIEMRADRDAIWLADVRSAPRRRAACRASCRRPGRWARGADRLSWNCV